MGSFLRGPNQVNQELTQFFKDNGFEVSWDHDRYYEWIEIYENNKMIMQIESNVTVEKFIDLLIRDYKSRQEGVFIDAGFFIAGDIFDNAATRVYAKCQACCTGSEFRCFSPKWIHGC